MSEYSSSRKNAWMGEQARAWWQSIQYNGKKTERPKGRFHVLDRADRARCARCVTLDELQCERAPLLLFEALTDASRVQNNRLTEWLLKNYEGVLLVAGVLAHVRKDVENDKSLVLPLGFAELKKEERPKLSELRFRRLLAEESYEAFFHAVRRVVCLRGQEGVSVARLAVDLLEWSRQREQASSRMKFEWAKDYYLSAKDQKIEAETTVEAVEI